MTKVLSLGGRFTRSLLRDCKGLALLEFAFTLPIVLLMCLGGAELANYTITRMRVSQIALHIADNAARMGEGPQMAAKTISEVAIGDVFIGAHLQSGRLDLKGKGRVILSDLEPIANPNSSNKYKIAWQRCYGDRVHASSFGRQGDTDLDGIGPADQQVTAQDDNATMFVEVYYVYTPLIENDFMPNHEMVEIASMPVRDRRNLEAGIDNSAGVPRLEC